SARAMRRVGLSAWADHQRDTGGAMIATAWAELCTLLGEGDPLPVSLSFHPAVPPRVPRDTAAAFEAARQRFLAAELHPSIPEAEATAHREGLARLHAGDFPAAASRLRDALLGMEAALGSENLLVLARLPHLAAAYHGVGKDLEARLVWERSRARLATAGLESVLGAPEASPPDTPRGKR
ncbi:MAG TPA: hypothetical protein VMV18_00765, partial [bacterium]|nr:hypothetical protein [bacterium]